jgi:hypothetical protein
MGRGSFLGVPTYAQGAAVTKINTGFGAVLVNRKPLHVARLIFTACTKRRNMIDVIPGAAPNARAIGRACVQFLKLILCRSGALRIDCAANYAGKHKDA